MTGGIIPYSGSVTFSNNKAPVLDYPTIRQYFAQGYVRDSVQVYTFNMHSGTRRFLKEKLSKGTTVLKMGADAMEVENDLQMVEKVSNDAYGIGYCSSAFFDPDRVKALALKAPDGKTYYYPQQGPQNRWVMPETLHHPLARTLYAEVGGNSWKKNRPNFVSEMLQPGGPGTQAVQDGPLFRIGYLGARD